MTDRELMQQALNALEYAADNTKPENMSGCECPICVTITALRDRLAQPEPVTGNILKDAYNAMVEKKTRSQKLREAGFTRRPKGWEKEKDEQEPVAWSYWQSCLNDDGTQTAPWVHRLSKFKPSESIINKEVIPLYTTPPQRKPLTFEEILSIAEEPRKHVYPSIAFARAIEAAHGIKP